METFETGLEQLESRLKQARRRALVVWALGLIVLAGAVVHASLPAARAQGEAGLQQRVAALEAQVSNQSNQIAALESLLMHFSRDDNDVFITGANLHIVNGLGITDSTNGVGNLIVGYNELRQDDININDRTGSHNIVVGRLHNFSSFGGLVVGFFNTISAQFASVSGGVGNTASGQFASVSGGSGHIAAGDRASVSGGSNNTASGFLASVSGGQLNTASGDGASVSGGSGNAASGDFASVSGGFDNTASGNSASVSGGNNVSQNIIAGWSAGSRTFSTVVGNFRSP